MYRFFKISAKSSTFRVAEAEAVEDNQKAHYLEPLGSIVVGKWPRVNLGKHDAGTSQWQILSNYLESLMQVVLCLCCNGCIFVLFVLDANISLFTGWDPQSNVRHH